MEEHRPHLPLLAGDDGTEMMRFMLETADVSVIRMLAYQEDPLVSRPFGIGLPLRRPLRLN